jgi:transposase
MPRAYSDDLRSRVLTAVEAGAPPPAVAERFAVGLATVYRWRQQAVQDGRRSAKPMRGGPKPMIRDEVDATLKRLVAGGNHLTLAEYAAALAAETGVRGGPWTVCRALQRLGQTRQEEDPARGRAGPGRHRRGAAGVANHGRRGRAGAPGVHRRERRAHQPGTPLCP